MTLVRMVTLSRELSSSSICLFLVHNALLPFYALFPGASPFQDFSRFPTRSFPEYLLSG